MYCHHCFIVLVGLRLICCLVHSLFFPSCFVYTPRVLSPHSSDKMGAVGVILHVRVRVCFCERSLSHRVLGVCVAAQQMTQRGDEVVRDAVDHPEFSKS